MSVTGRAGKPLNPVSVRERGTLRSIERTTSADLDEMLYLKGKIEVKYVSPKRIQADYFQLRLHKNKKKNALIKPSHRKTIVRRKEVKNEGNKVETVLRRD